MICHAASKMVTRCGKVVSSERKVSSASLSMIAEEKRGGMLSFLWRKEGFSSLATLMFV